jgi:hypothetical protein
MCVKSQLKVWGLDIGAGRGRVGGGGESGIHRHRKICENCRNIDMLLSSFMNDYHIEEKLDVSYCRQCLL